MGSEEVESRMHMWDETYYIRVLLSEEAKSKNTLRVQDPEDEQDPVQSGIQNLVYDASALLLKYARRIQALWR